MLLYHGQSDPTLHYQNVQMTYEYLRKEIYKDDYQYNYEYYDEGKLIHSLSDDVILKLKEWMANRFEEHQRNEQLKVVSTDQIKEVIRRYVSKDDEKAIDNLAYD